MSMPEFTQTLVFMPPAPRPAPAGYAQARRAPARPAADRARHGAAVYPFPAKRRHGAARQANARRGAVRRRRAALRAWLWAAAALLLVNAATLALLVSGRPAPRALWHSYGMGAARDIVTAALPPAVRASAPGAVPQGVRLPVQNIAQKPELPNGCEITSAAIALAYLGYPADKCTLAAQYLPCQAPYYAADPEQVYMGDPFSRGGGYYCMTGPVVTAVNAYLADAAPQGGGHTAVDLSGSTPAELKTVLDRGVPVLVWVTTDFNAPRTGYSFTLPGGQKPYTNLHCLVLTGYDRDGFFLADPLENYTRVSSRTFEEVYTAMGSRAVAVLPKR